MISIYYICKIGTDFFDDRYRGNLEVEATDEKWIPPPMDASNSRNKNTLPF